MSRRSFIYANEIAQIIGKTHRTAQRLISKIRRHEGKSAHQSITIRDFSKFMGIPEEEIRRWMK